MKNLLFLAFAVMMSFTVNAQSLTFNNNSPCPGGCDVWVKVYFDHPLPMPSCEVSDPTDPWLVSACAVPWNMTHTWNNTNSWVDCAGNPLPPVPGLMAGYIVSRVEVYFPCYDAAGNQIFVTISDYSSGQNAKPYYFALHNGGTASIPCCGDRTFNWTDMGGGNIKVDMN
jgi:hypothetical protein